MYIFVLYITYCFHEIIFIRVLTCAWRRSTYKGIFQWICKENISLNKTYYLVSILSYNVFAGFPHWPCFYLFTKQLQLWGCQANVTLVSFSVGFTALASSPFKGTCQTCTQPHRVPPSQRWEQNSIWGCTRIL